MQTLSKNANFVSHAAVVERPKPRPRVELTGYLAEAWTRYVDRTREDGTWITSRAAKVARRELRSADHALANELDERAAEMGEADTSRGRDWYDTSALHERILNKCKRSPTRPTT